MLLSYVVSCIYVLILGAYWIYTFARNTHQFHQIGLSPGIVISLVSLCTLITLIIASILYFCYLRYKLKFNHKQIVSKTMRHCGRGWWGLLALDLALGIVIYYFTFDENMDYKQDFIKLHCLFIIMILFVGSFNGLKWFRLKRVWEVLLFTLFLVATGAMYFIDFYFHQHQPMVPNPYFPQNQGLAPTDSDTTDEQKLPSQPQFLQRPQFQQYISGPMIITYQYMYLSLSQKYVSQKVICKLVQYFSIGIFIKRVHFFIRRAVPETFFSFDFVWAIIICVMTLIMISRDVYSLIKYAINKCRRKDREKYIQEFRAKVRDFLQERTEKKAPLQESQYHLGEIVVEDCVICLSAMDNSEQRMITRLDCRHSFHFNCIFEWFNKQTVCPVCRHEYQVVAEATHENQGNNHEGF